MRLAGWIGAMSVLVATTSASADVISPEVAACNGLDAGAPCANGTCRASTCSKLDYSSGVPPKSVSYACVECVTGGSTGGASAGGASAGGASSGPASAGAASMVAPSTGGTSSGGTSAVATSKGGSSTQATSTSPDTTVPKESSSSSSSCTITGRSTRSGSGWALLLGAAGLGLVRRRRVHPAA
jgi:MYXO-CTERM domain-containing protein